MVIMMELQLQPLAAEGNGLLARNPDRGLRLELYMGEEIACDVFTVSRMANPAAHIERVIEKGIARCAPEQITLAQVYFYLTGYRGGEIDEAGFQAMQIYFDTLRAHGLKALLRFAYSTDPGVNDATQADMLRHIEQLRPFLERNKAYIHVLQAGMIGAWGEWHSEKKRVSRKKILRALAQAAPEGMYLQVRLPGLLKLLGKRHPAYCRTGLHDDSFFGNIKAKQYENGGFDPGTRMYRTALAKSPESPQDGELYWSSWNHANGVYCDGLRAVERLAELHFTSLSAVHGYQDYPEDETKTTMGRWKRQEITPELLAERGILCDLAWFCNESGERVSRSVFAYVRDHLGYRLQAKTLRLEGDWKPGAQMHAALTVSNYGFAAGFHLHAGFAMLDSSGRVLCECPAGEPDQWRAAQPGGAGEAPRYTTAAWVPLPKKSGEYRLAFYLRNSAGQCAKLANQMEMEHGYHILYPFSLL